MADHPIPYSNPMVRALLAGSKTQTRRVLRPQPRDWQARVIDIGTPQRDCDEDGDEIADAWGQVETVWSGPLVPGMCEPDHEEWHPIKAYRIGDRLWVREAYYQYGHWEPVTGELTAGGKQKWAFIPDDSQILFERPHACRGGMNRADPFTACWHKRLGRFMPRSASRMTQIVTDVRVQRLHDISEEDAKAEGVEPQQLRGEAAGLRDAFKLRHLPFSSAYANLWNHINGRGAWEANPWVVAYSFDTEMRNIDSNA